MLSDGDGGRRRETRETASFPIGGRRGNADAEDARIDDAEKKKKRLLFSGGEGEGGEGAPERFERREVRTWNRKVAFLRGGGGGGRGACWYGMKVEEDEGRGERVLSAAGKERRPGWASQAFFGA